MYHKELIVSNSRLMIGATKTYKMCKEHVNGYENIGATLNDFKNFHRDVKCYINERDGQLFVDRFKNLADTREDFYFDYEVDADNSVARAVWADGAARRNYAVFGDAVSFDSTYSTNKYSMVFTPFTGVDNHRRSVTFCGALLFRENGESFTWLFRRFLEAMGGKEPQYIITDQDPGIIASVANVFKTVRHRFCTWHIMNKVLVKYEFDIRWSDIMAEHMVGPEREWFQEVFKIRRQWVLAHCRYLIMGSVLRTTQRSESENSFFKKFENSSGTLVEFWMRFESVIDQQRHTQKKLDNDNRHSSPKLLTQMPIENHGARVYTHVLFDDFQQEVISSTRGLSVRAISERNGVEITTLKDGLVGKLFDVQFDIATLQVCCTCLKFERCGMICRHIISILSSNGLNSILDGYVVRRWCKDAVGRTVDHVDVIDGRQVQLTRLWSEVYETVGLLKASDKDDIESLCTLIRDFRETLDPTTEELTKEHEIQQLLGFNTAKNKGSGKRMLSTKAVAVAKAAKPKRLCGNFLQRVTSVFQRLTLGVMLFDATSGSWSVTSVLHRET
ncbi:hypothetical protein RND81_14G157900 [Saponaria officinalis]|uniref:SWIM-type domain-containing protein n=1 Tax=Saponaria officinalis TaxID=3572 RepID=A0AAW1GSR3_SAPOF